MIPFILSYLYLSYLLSYLLSVISVKKANLVCCLTTILGLRRLGILLPYNYLLLSPFTHLKGLPQDLDIINLLRWLHVRADVTITNKCVFNLAD